MANDKTPGLGFIKIAEQLAGLAQRADEAKKRGETVNVDKLFQEANAIMSNPDRPDDKIIEQEGPPA